MSRGIGSIGKLTLAVMAHNLDCAPHWRDECAKVYHIARQVASMAEGKAADHYRADCYGLTSAGDHFNIGRVLAMLERRGLVKRIVYGSGSLAYLTHRQLESGPRTS